MRRTRGGGPCAKKFLRLPPLRFAAHGFDRSRHRRRSSATSPFNLPIQANSKLECRNPKQIQITKTQIKRFKRTRLRFRISDFLLLRVPARIALGDGDKYYRNHGDHEADGRYSAAHAVKIKKIQQRAKRF